MRYPPLLIAQFIVMLLAPFAHHFRSFDVDSVLLLIVYLTAVYAFRNIHRMAGCLSILAAISVTLRFAADHWGLFAPEIISHGLGFIAMVLIMIAVFSEVLHARTASTDLVIGAVCLYFVIVLAWMFLYYSVDSLSPGSIFVTPAPLTESASESKFADMFYFSLSDLTGFGSSGAPPLSVMAQQLAVVESAMGQLYLAVLISRLVGFSTANDPKAS